MCVYCALISYLILHTEFALTELEVAEPESTPPAIASFTVQRVGGAVGVVGVAWTVTRADGSAVSDDVLPVSGTLAFVSNSRQQTIRLSVLPDTVPERTEVRGFLKYT